MTSTELMNFCYRKKSDYLDLKYFSTVLELPCPTKEEFNKYCKSLEENK